MKACMGGGAQEQAADDRAGRSAKAGARERKARLELVRGAAPGRIASTFTFGKTLGAPRGWRFGINVVT